MDPLHKLHQTLKVAALVLDSAAGQIRDLRAALLRSETQARTGNGLNGFRVLKSYIPQYLLRKLGWAIWNAYPQAPMQYVRYSRMLYKEPSI